MPSTSNGSGTLGSPERNSFFYGKLMDAAAFQKDQSYFNHKRSLVNRFVLGTGVVCGLDVVQDGEADAMLRIDPGLAIDASGREIVVCAPALLDPRQPTNDRGEAEGAPVVTGAVEIRLVYAESTADPVPVLVADCDTPGGCAPSTIRERFRILVREAADDIPAPPACGFSQLQSPPADKPLHEFIHALLCERVAGTDAAPPQHDGVRLARVALQDSAISTIDPAAGRQLVYSNALLFELILCLAGQIHALSNRT